MAGKYVPITRKYWIITDGVIIALPTHLHHPVSMDFLARGIPVLCEKPLAESVNKAQEMVDMANKTGTVLADELFPTPLAAVCHGKGNLLQANLLENLVHKILCWRFIQLADCFRIYIFSRKCAAVAFCLTGAPMYSIICVGGWMANLRLSVPKMTLLVG